MWQCLKIASHLAPGQIIDLNILCSLMQLHSLNRLIGLQSILSEFTIIDSCIADLIIGRNIFRHTGHSLDK